MESITVQSKPIKLLLEEKLPSLTDKTLFGVSHQKKVNGNGRSKQQSHKVA